MDIRKPSLGASLSRVFVFPNRKQGIMNTNDILTEKVQAMEKKLEFWKGFASGAAATLAAIAFLVGVVCGILQIAKI
nr:MAG TPA: hypothetical protein [Caudoviricetes sp.]